MKKIILSLSLSIFAMISFAQDAFTIVTNKAQIGKWNNKTDKYDYGEMLYNDITFKFYSDLIVAENKSGTIYKIVKRLPSDQKPEYRTMTFLCEEQSKDRRGTRLCTFNITQYNDNSAILYTIYEDICLVYYVKPSLSKF